ncbi:MAG: PspC domain-containing protein [Ignavibacteria bacterium]|nr:PspC domain-containing protein [Ignavibacteria bacterium]
MEKRLYRSTSEKMAAGVCGGLAKYLDIDPVIIRLIFVVLTVFSGIGAIIYITCVFIMPKEPVQPVEPLSEEAAAEIAQKQEEKLHKHSRRRTFFGYALVLIGGLILLSNYIPQLCFHDLFPVILVIFGLYLILNPSQKGA